MLVRTNQIAILFPHTFWEKKDGGFAVESDYEKSRKSMSSNVFLKVIVKKFNLKSVQAKLNSSLLRQYLKKHSNN